MSDLTILEGFGMAFTIMLSCAGGYCIGASVRQLYEDRVEPKWLTTLGIVAATVGFCAGTALAIYWAINNK